MASDICVFIFMKSLCSSRAEARDKNGRNKLFRLLRNSCSPWIRQGNSAWWFYNFKVTVRFPLNWPRS